VRFSSFDAKANGGSGLAFDELDDFVDGHEAGVDPFALIKGGDGDDAIVEFELSVAIGRASGDDAGDAGGAIVFRDEGGSDADEFVAHTAIELVGFPSGEVFGVWVVGSGDGAEEGVGDVFFIEGFDILKDAFVLKGASFAWVGLVDEGVFFVLIFGAFANVFAVDEFAEKAAFDFELPALGGFGIIFGPGCFFAIAGDGAISVECEFLVLQEILSDGDTFFDALAVERENVAGRLHGFALENEAVEFTAVFF